MEVEVERAGGREWMWSGCGASGSAEGGQGQQERSAPRRQGWTSFSRGSSPGTAPTDTRCGGACVWVCLGVFVSAVY